MLYEGHLDFILLATASSTLLPYAQAGYQHFGKRKWILVGMGSSGNLEIIT